MTEASIMGFLSQSSVTVTSTTQDYSSFEAWRLQPESGISGIITTSAALKAGVILSVTLLEKDINDPEYIIANRKMVCQKGLITECCCEVRHSLQL